MKVIVLAEQIKIFPVKSGILSWVIELLAAEKGHMHNDSAMGLQTLKMLQVCASQLCLCNPVFVSKTVRKVRAFV